MVRFFAPVLICSTRRWSRSCERLDIFHLLWCLDTPRPWSNDDSCVSEASKNFKGSLCNFLCLWSGPLYRFYFGLRNFVYAKSIAKFWSGHHYHSFLLIHLFLCLWWNRSYSFMIYNIRQWSRSCERLDIFHLFWCLDTPRSSSHDWYISEASKFLKVSFATFFAYDLGPLPCSLLCLVHNRSCPFYVLLRF